MRNIRTLASPWRFQFTWWFSHFFSLSFVLLWLSIEFFIYRFFSLQCYRFQFLFAYSHFFALYSLVRSIFFSLSKCVFSLFTLKCAISLDFQLTTLVMASYHLNHLSVNFGQRFKWTCRTDFQLMQMNECEIQTYTHIECSQFIACSLFNFAGVKQTERVYLTRHCFFSC